MATLTLDQAVRNYNLFGETGDLPDVVHCETIAARSRLHDWSLEQHRHSRLHQVLLLDKGGGEVVVEGRRHGLRPKNAVNLPVGCIHGFSFRPGSDGWVVTLAAEMLEATLAPSDTLHHVLATPAVFTASARMRGLMRDIFKEYDGRDFARAQVLRSLSGVLLGVVARFLPHDGTTPRELPANGLYRRFETLLEAHYADHWRVTDYARALNVTPVHLSRVANAVAGSPASRLIEERLLREARRNLVYTGLPVSTIAYRLGFADPAYFSRVFARMTGMSPRAFRDSVLRENDRTA